MKLTSSDAPVRCDVFDSHTAIDRSIGQYKLGTIFIIIKCSNEQHRLKILDLGIDKGIAIIIQACDSVVRKRGGKQEEIVWKKRQNFERSTTSRAKGSSNSIKIKMALSQSQNIQLALLLTFIFKRMY